MVSFSGMHSPRPRIPQRGHDCPTCGKLFAASTPKAVCPCCFKLCCSQCVQAECSIVSGDRPIKVCVSCFLMLQSSRDSSTFSVLPLYAVPSVSSTPLGSSASARGRAFMSPSPDTAATDSRPRVPDATMRRNAAEKLNLERRAPLPSPRVFRELSLSARREEAPSQPTQGKPPCAPSCGRVESGPEGDQKISVLQEEIDRLRKQNTDLNSKLQEFHEHVEVTERKLNHIVNQTQIKEQAVHNLQRRVTDYEEEVGRLRQLQNSPDKMPLSSSAPASARCSNPSIVHATILTVVPTKLYVAPCGDIDISDWGFDTVELASLVPSALQTVASEVVRRWNMFDSPEEMQRWSHMVAAIENNYRPNPFHNAVRAADVLQAVFSLVSVAKPLMRHLTLIELKALVFAAVALDVRHPGRTNEFLVRTRDPLCLRYPGPATLEQMHVATAFQLLEIPGLNFTCRMSKESFLRFKDIVSQLIRRTDVAAHGENLDHWRAKACEGGFDYGAPEDRVDALSLLLLAADLSAGARGLDIGRRWLVIMEEHAAQAEEERRWGLPVTPGFAIPSSVERAQLAYLDSVVVPLFDRVQQLFPGIVEPSRNLRALRSRYAACTAPSGLSTSLASGGEGSRDGVQLSAALGPTPCYRQGDDPCRAKPPAPLPEGRGMVPAAVQPPVSMSGSQADRLHERGGAFHLDLTRCVAPGSARDRPSGVTRSEYSPRLAECLTHREYSPALSSGRGRYGIEAGGPGERWGRVGRAEQAFVAPSRSPAPATDMRFEKAPSLRPTGRESVMHLRGGAWGAPVGRALNVARSPNRWDGDERLVRKYCEMDDLLLHVRAMRVGGMVARGDEGDYHQLRSSLAEREAAIAEAALLLRQRRCAQQGGPPWTG